MALVELPKSLEDYMQIRKKYENVISLNYPSEVKEICRYSGAALAINRSCSNVMIMMAGESGAGKSTTINKLFNDNNLCKTSINTSATSTVWEIEASLIIKDHEKPWLKTSLMFLDVPGALDVEASKRDSNQDIVKKYLTTSPYLEARPSKILDSLDGYAKPENRLQSALCWKKEESTWKSYRKVYPNLILLTVNATDNRMVGPDSNLCKALQMLKELDAIDFVRPNLIVVATNAAALSRNVEHYTNKVTKITSDIHELLIKVLEVQPLCETKVVFIENDSDGQDLEKLINSDFYKLPDGTTSHFNLIQSMIEQFYDNQDLLGMVTCGSFFGSECIKENKAVNLRECIFNASDLNKEQQAEIIAQKIENMKVQMVQELPLKYIGRGFCPSTEKRKCKTILQPLQKMQMIALSGETYSTHSQLKCLTISETNCERWSQDTKEHYVRKRNGAYGVETGIDFDIDVSVNPCGKWENNVGSTSERSTITFLYEYRALSLQLENPKNEISTDLLQALKFLPKEFRKETSEKYDDFFNEWGSHFIQKSYVGGSIQMYYSRQSGNADNVVLDSKLQSKVEERFKLLEVNSTLLTESSTDIDLYNVRLKFHGGTPPPTTSLRLAELSSVVLKNWILSIPKNPVELQYYIKLEPYYLLVDEPQKSSLRSATKHYFIKDTEMSLTRENVSSRIRGQAKNTEFDDSSADFNESDISDSSTPTRDIPSSPKSPKSMLNALWQPFRNIFNMKLF